MFTLNSEHEVTVLSYEQDHGDFSRRKSPPLTRYTLKANTPNRYVSFKTFTKGNYKKGDKVLVRVTEEHHWNPRVEICNITS